MGTKLASYKKKESQITWHSAINLILEKKYTYLNIYYKKKKFFILNMKLKVKHVMINFKKIKITETIKLYLW
jgi:hypothetical protein